MIFKEEAVKKIEGNNPAIKLIDAINHEYSNIDVATSTGDRPVNPVFAETLKLNIAFKNFINNKIQEIGETKTKDFGPDVKQQHVAEIMAAIKPYVVDDFYRKHSNEHIAKTILQKIEEASQEASVKVTTTKEKPLSPRKRILNGKRDDRDGIATALI